MRVLVRRIKGRGKLPNLQGAIDEVKKTAKSKIKPEVLEYFNSRILGSLDLDIKFRARFSVRGNEFVLYVYPTGPDTFIWRILSITGSGLYGPKKRKYPIRPKKKGGRLSFIWGGYGSYKPKTTTSGGYKGPGTVIGDRVAFKGVMHPGIKPRHFEKHVARWYRPKFRKHIENAIRRGLRR